MPEITKKINEWIEDNVLPDKREELRELFTEFADVIYGDIKTIINKQD